MEKKNTGANQGNNSMDGFVRRNVAVPRRLGQPSLSPLGAAQGASSVGSTNELRTLGRASMLASTAKTDSQAPQAAPAPRGRNVTKGDLDESLKAIDKDPKKHNKNDPYLKAKRRKRIKWIIITIVFLLIAGAAYFAINAFIASSKVFKGNIFEAITESNTPLQKDSYGKTNILVFGTSEDDPGHDGANLTDSMMILSIDQTKNTASMVSIPRDLWVQYDKSCSVGYAGKINAAYVCALNNTDNDEDAAAKQLMAKVDTVFDMQLQYYAHVNYTVVKDAVNAVGGVDVNIVGDGSSGIYDTNFDWNCPNGKPYTCKNVYYPKDGVYHLDGTQALYLARARADGGRYSYKDFGLARGDFDRQANQRKILTALVTKAKSAGTLANPVTVLNLINSLGDNIRTNFQTKEINTLVKLGKTIDANNIADYDITAANLKLITTGTGPDGSSIVKPTAGLLDYSGLQAYMKSVLSGDTSALENATVSVYNGSNSKGVATTTATTLKNAGFNVDTIDDTDTEYTPKYTLYDLTGGKKPQTLAKLQKQLGVTVTSGTPAGIDSSDDFVVVVGNNISATSTSN